MDTGFGYGRKVIEDIVGFLKHQMNTKKNIRDAYIVANASIKLNATGFYTKTGFVYIVPLQLKSWAIPNAKLCYRRVFRDIPPSRERAV